jgi:hypothetical protein
MRRLVGIFFLITFSFLGIGIVYSEEHLMNLCRGPCAGNAILYILFGSAIGKILLGILSAMVGVGVFWITWCKKDKGKDYYLD